MVLVEGGGFRGRDFRAVGASAQEAVVSLVDCQVGLGSTSGAGDREDAREFSPEPLRHLPAPRAPLAPRNTGGFFVDMTFVKFVPPRRRQSLLVVYQVGLGSTSALETGRMLGIFFRDSSAFS